MDLFKLLFELTEQRMEGEIRKTRSVRKDQLIIASLAQMLGHHRCETA